MKKFLNSIVNFFKAIFGQDIRVSVQKNQKYNIIINDNGDLNGKKY